MCSASPPRATVSCLLAPAPVTWGPGPALTSLPSESWPPSCMAGAACRALWPCPLLKLHTSWWSVLPAPSSLACCRVELMRLTPLHGHRLAIKTALEKNNNKKKLFCCGSRGKYSFYILCKKVRFRFQVRCNCKHLVFVCSPFGLSEAR